MDESNIIWLFQLPHSVLEIFRKSNYIEEISIDGIRFKRDEYLKHNSNLSSGQKDVMLRENPKLEKFMTRSICTLSPSKDDILKALQDNNDCLIRFKCLDKKDRVILKLYEWAQFLRIHNIIDEDFYNSLLINDKGIFCFIDDNNLSGFTQDLLILSDHLFFNYKITEIDVVNLKPNLSDHLEVVSKYVIFKKNFITISGNSGGGNLTSYLTDESISDRIRPDDEAIKVQTSLRLKKL